jgi:hypothetical protein
MEAAGDADFNSLKAACKDLCSELQEQIERDLLYVKTKTVTNNEAFTAKSTVRNTPDPFLLYCD